MRSTLEPWLLRRWYGGVAPGLALRMLERVYAARTGRRREVFLRQPPPPSPVPVIVVGNLLAGGTGKTPLCGALLADLQTRGWRPGLASRGYGRDRRAGLWVEADTPVALAGDEPLMLARDAGVPVRVDVDRVAAVHALALRGCDVVVCDDGLQHYRLARDMEIEVCDAARGYGNGHLLPAGPLREPPERALACDFKVVHVGADAADAAVPDGAFRMCLRPRGLRPLVGGADLPLAEFRDRAVHAVAAIGHPARFFASLRACGMLPNEHPFPDHHRFAADELRFAEPLPIVTTGKDSLRWPPAARDGVYQLLVDVEISPVLFAALDERLRQCVARRKNPG